MPAIAIANALKTVHLKRVSGGSPPPPDPGDTLLLTNGTDSLLLVDGTSFLKLASSS